MSARAITWRAPLAIIATFLFALAAPPLQAAMPPASAIAAKIEHRRARDAKVSFSLTLTERRGEASIRWRADRASCQDGKISLVAPDREETLSLSLTEGGAGFMLWVVLCEPRPLLALGKLPGGLIASEVSIKADPVELFYQLGTVQRITISHDLERVLGARARLGEGESRQKIEVAARGVASEERGLPSTIVVWRDGRQIMTGRLSLLARESTEEKRAK